MSCWKLSLQILKSSEHQLQLSKNEIWVSSGKVLVTFHLQEHFQNRTLVPETTSALICLKGELTWQQHRCDWRKYSSIPATGSSGNIQDQLLTASKENLQETQDVCILDRFTVSNEKIAIHLLLGGALPPWAGSGFDGATRQHATVDGEIRLQTAQHRHNTRGRTPSQRLSCSQVLAALATSG